MKTLGQEEDGYVLFIALVRWGGLLAVLSAALSAAADSVALFFVFADGSNAGFVFRDMTTQ